MISDSLLRNMDSSHFFVPMKPGAYSCCPAGWSSSRPGYTVQRLAHSRPSLPLLLPCRGQPRSVCLRVLSGLPVCVGPAEAFRWCFESLTKEAESPVHGLLAHSSKQSFFFELRTEQAGPGGSLACAPWAQELSRRKLGSLSVNYFNDKSRVLFCLLFSGCTAGPVGSCFPNQGPNQCPQHWKCRVRATDHQGIPKSSVINGWAREGLL